MGKKITRYYYELSDMTISDQEFIIKAEVETRFLGFLRSIKQVELNHRYLLPAPYYINYVQTPVKRRTAEIIVGVLNSRNGY